MVKSVKLTKMLKLHPATATTATKQCDASKNGPARLSQIKNNNKQHKRKKQQWQI